MSVSGFSVVIPARYESTRLPGKPLVDIAGLPMIVRVAERAVESGAREVIVATDDQRIVEAVERAGYRALLTRSDHASGSDRVMEVVVACGWNDQEIVLNVQGDEPLIPPDVISQLARRLAADDSLAAATLCEPIKNRATLLDPNVVKVVRSRKGLALYFSRAPVPYDRHSFAAELVDLAADRHWWRHIGVYAYRVWALAQFVGLPVSELEATESLEQLRLLDNGMDMLVEQACESVPGGVDTPADLERIRALLSTQ
jgi:3-deoxy-manno-octulosonate cytidylyltransferase (CMP-KDO synthetase)